MTSAELLCKGMLEHQVVLDSHLQDARCEGHLLL